MNSSLDRWIDFYLTFLGKDVLRTALRPQLTADEHHTNNILEHQRLIKSPDCIHRDFSPTLGFIRCANNAAVEGVKHGWLCQDHQLREPRRKIVQQQVEINAHSVLLTDARAIHAGSGTKISTHQHLMRATVYKRDGTAKFPW